MRKGEEESEGDMRFSLAQIRIFRPIFRVATREKKWKKEQEREREKGVIRRYIPRYSAYRFLPEKCVIHGKRNRTLRKQRVIRASAIHRAHLNRESTATRRLLTTEEVKNERKLT